MNDIQLLIYIAKEGCNTVQGFVIHCFTNCPIKYRNRDTFQCAQDSKRSAKFELQQYSQEEIFEAML